MQTNIPTVFEVVERAAVWVATNPGQEGDRERVLREAARLNYQGEPPPPVAAWLADRGIEV